MTVPLLALPLIALSFSLAFTVHRHARPGRTPSADPNPPPIAYRRRAMANAELYRWAAGRTVVLVRE